MAYCRGLGAWPSDCFYDPARPSWLPYFFDTPTESQNKLACALSTGAAGPVGIVGAKYIAKPVTDPYSLPVAPVTVVPPDLSLDPNGYNVDIDQQLAAQKAAQQAAVQAWAKQQTQQTPVDESSPGAVLNRISNALNPDASSFANKYGVYVIGGAILLGSMFFLGGRR